MTILNRPADGSARYEFEREEFASGHPYRKRASAHTVAGDLAPYLNDEAPLPSGCWLAWPHYGRCQRLVSRTRVEE